MVKTDWLWLFILWTLTGFGEKEEYICGDDDEEVARFFEWLRKLECGWKIKMVIKSFKLMAFL